MEDYLFHVEKEGKVGFINDRGQVVIDFTFEEASLFAEGFARVFYKGKVGFIDTKGNLVIPIQFEHVSEFSEGLAVVTIKDKKGYIDTAGQIVIPPLFYEADNFKNGFAKVREDMMTAGSFIDKYGKSVLANRIALTSMYNEGLINCKENEKWGYMDISGNITINPIFQYARPFYEGKAAVKEDARGKKSKNENLYGFINKTGEMIIPPIYAGADIKFSEDRCAVWDEKFGYINTSGELIISYQFNLGEHFSEGLAYFQFNEADKYGFIDKTGNIVIRPAFDSVSSFKNGLAAVFLGKKFGKTLSGYINKKGDYVWEPSR